MIELRPFAKLGGADQGKFTINPSTGVLAFITAPNFSPAGDANADNIYDVSVRASDGTLTDTQVLAVTVTAPVLGVASGVLGGQVGTGEGSLDGADRGAFHEAVGIVGNPLPAHGLRGDRPALRKAGRLGARERLVSRFRSSLRLRPALDELRNR